MRKAARFTDAIHSSGVSPWLVLFLSPSAVLCMCFTMYLYVVVCTCKKNYPLCMKNKSQKQDEAGRVSAIVPTYGLNAVSNVHRLARMKCF